jgi:hypothetical protein
MTLGLASARRARTLWRFLRTYPVQICMVLLFCGVALYYVPDREQSFTVEAATQSLRVTTNAGLANVWELGSSTLCRRVETPVGDGDANCSAEYTAHSVTNAELAWPAGYTLTIRGGGDDDIIVEIDAPDQTADGVLYGDVDITNNSLLRIPGSELRRLGTLPLAGAVAVGQPPYPGASRLLRGGTYEIRENLLFAGRPSLVRTGELRLGDYFSLIDRDGNPIEADLFIAPSENVLASFDVVLTTPLQRSAINVLRVGGASTTFTTSWTDRLTNDSFPIAMSALLTLLLTSFNIAQAFGVAGAASAPSKPQSAPTPTDRAIRQLRRQGKS